MRSRVQGLLPGNFLAAVASLSTNDRGKRAFSDVLGFIDRLAGTHAVDEILVFVPIGTADWLAVSPGASFGGCDLIGAVARAVFAAYKFAHRAFAVVDLAALTEHRDAVWVLILNRKVIVDVTVSIAPTALSAT